jgi:MFS transporter, DHA1 family, tetracycline resistance protein
MKSKPLMSIFLVVFIDLLGFSLILPLLPYYAKTFSANETVTGLLVASYAAMQLIGAPILGRLSDRYGRRPILLISIFGTFIGFLMLGFARSLWVLFSSRMLDGITGGNLSVAQAYISDITDEKNRAKGLGMIGAAFGLGFIIGPVTGGLLSQWGYAVPAFAAAGLSLINLLLTYFWLPESLRPEKRAISSQSKIRIDFSSLRNTLRRPLTGSLLITRFFFGLAFSMFQTIFSLYALTRFSLTAAQTGYILTYVGILSVFTQGFLVGRITSRVRDGVLVTLGILVMSLCMLGWALAPSVVMLLVVLLPTAITGGILNTVISSYLTKTVAPQEIGGILGFSTSVESMTRVLAPILAGVLIARIGSWAPGAVSFFILAGLSPYVWMKIMNHPGPTIKLPPEYATVVVDVVE